MNIERRKFIRYKVPINAISIYSNYSPVHGWLKNISYGGIAFKYSPIDDCHIQPEIRLILASETFSLYLPEVHFKVIYDTKISKNDRPFKKTVTRCCGAQYKKLDTDMQEKLMFFLSNKLMLP